jgi:hypothetical protein
MEKTIMVLHATANTRRMEVFPKQFHAFFLWVLIISLYSADSSSVGLRPAVRFL